MYANISLVDTSLTLRRSIDNLSYKDALYAFLIQPIWKYISSILRFIAWTPLSKEGSVALDNPPNEPLLDDRPRDDNITPSDKPSAAPDERRLAQFEAYLAEKKRRKAAKRFKRLLESASVSESGDGYREHLKGLKGPPTDVGSVASSTWSGWSHSTSSPHEADSGSAFSLTQDDIAGLKELHRQKYGIRRTKVQN